jgi:diadenosine tetraphosphate (Ap4A) HIT family hydrolase
MDLTPEYWRERAERVRKIADFVDEAARETLLRIAGNYESLALQAKSGTSANQSK